MKKMPMVRLHGDAHLEQYAFTDTAFGLDDFDNTTEGSAVIDLVRFIGSMRLVTRERGWTGDSERLTDAFFQGLSARSGRPERHGGGSTGGPAAAAAAGPRSARVPRLG